MNSSYSVIGDIYTLHIQNQSGQRQQEDNDEIHLVRFETCFFEEG